MTEKELWIKAAKAFEGPVTDETSRGICYWLDTLVGLDKWHTMRTKTKIHTTGLYMFGEDLCADAKEFLANRPKRASFCRRMAEECEKETKQ